jgi:hypothetical protein
MSGKAKNRDKSSEICSHCRKKGHSDVNCWIKPGNKDKVPGRMKKKIERKEVVTFSSSGSNVEVMVCKLSFRKDLKIPLDPKCIYCILRSINTYSSIGMVDL